MATTAPTNTAPLTDEAFLEDRMAIWKSFNVATVIGTVSVIALVVGMWIFLV